MDMRKFNSTITDVQSCRKAIVKGRRRAAAAWLATQDDGPAVLVLRAINTPPEPMVAWQKALEALQPGGPSEDLLLAHRGLARLHREGQDRAGQAFHLRAAAEVARHLQRPLEEAELLTILATTESATGHPQKAKRIHSRALECAVQHNDDLLIIINGTVLCGMLMAANQWADAAAIAALIESASKRRQNWIALASARLQRSTCVLVEGRQDQAVQLLLECGEALYKVGAVAALNLIKARLGELQRLLGPQKMSTLQQLAQQKLQNSGQ